MMDTRSYNTPKLGAYDLFLWNLMERRNWLLRIILRIVLYFD